MKEKLVYEIICGGLYQSRLLIILIRLIKKTIMGSKEEIQMQKMEHKDNAQGAIQAQRKVQARIVKHNKKAQQIRKERLTKDNPVSRQVPPAILRASRNREVETRAVVKQTVFPTKNRKRSRS